uniref:rRNA-processing protein EBP2 n=1 Tax=Chlamydomonas leiostraca TaxID=1034604 RepID=A0A7S0RRS0_9CHLO|mmetsp:Transcript_2987/g.7370  ORF Transcript_2987/g.7370 Transcript_2987/m.7370 type:complete len:354 (+) Transcript_2987:168-1229(+)|eukprot:CAMPEP_0202859426 /NCGR_PEP_ID=MMETSP1391-20130828/1544_1 /ASSEMBLY_ACC=CAM_ASM_000867 /TAXON_ID=1034604 /ORGANISM="Chlamydomonas leiostraca, Strain SAG 11-49" /LENGTH=353 /DNA_ID=CAMNT_0049538459 /DNA_START=167 /DNA_END=1228 /DNA_ORIENTATION=+
MGKKSFARPPSDSEDEFDDMDSDFDDEDLPMSSGEGEEEEEEEAAGAGPGSQAGKKKGGSKRPEREPIYDVEAMHEKLEDIGWADEATWEETQAITHDDPKQVEDVDDDISRELSFYNQALSAAQEAIRRFDSAGQPWLRPPDYYAEMVKTDQHMAKVKEQLMHEQASIEQAEERRKARESKQRAKQVQAEKVKERNANKKRQIDEISKLRKQREKSGYAGNVDFDAEIKNIERGGRAGQASAGGRGGPGGKGFRDRGAPPGGSGTPGKKRLMKNAKFGYGGAKRAKKQNDAASAANMDGYRPGKFRDQFGGKGGKGKGGKGPGSKGPGGVKKQPMKRPGKTARAAGKNKKQR